MLRQLPRLGGPSSWPDEDAPVGWGVLAVVLAWIGAQAFAAYWLVAVTGLLDRSADDALDPDQPFWVYFVSAMGLWIAFLAAPFVVARIAGGRPLADFRFGLDRGTLLLGLAVGIGTQVVLLPLLYWPILRLTDADPEEFAVSLLDRADDPIGTILLVLGIVVLGPLAEEWMYRGLLLAAMVRWVGPIAGAVGSSLAFALLHDPITIPGIFVFSLLLSWLVLRTGRISTAIVAHMAFNGTTVLVQQLAG